MALTLALAARRDGAPAEALETARAILVQEALAMETIEDAYVECVDRRRSRWATSRPPRR